MLDGVRFLGATLWTDFELAIETPEGPVRDAARAMKMATNLLNDYTLIRAPDESAEPSTWRRKQEESSKWRTRFGFIRRSALGYRRSFRSQSLDPQWL